MKLTVFNTARYVRELIKKNPEVKQMTVGVFDNDGCLVINICKGTKQDINEGNTELIGMHDTGLEGWENDPDVNALAEKLVEILQNHHIDAELYE